MDITELIFMKLALAWQLSVQNSYTKFWTNLNNYSAAVPGLDLFLCNLSLYRIIHWRHEFSLNTSKNETSHSYFLLVTNKCKTSIRNLKYLIRTSLNGFRNSGIFTCVHQHKIESIWSRTLHFHATRMSSAQMCIDPMPDHLGIYIFYGGA